jgi:hypothetical protein
MHAQKRLTAAAVAVVARPAELLREGEARVRTRDHIRCKRLECIGDLRVRRGLPTPPSDHLASPCCYLALHRVPVPVLVSRRPHAQRSQQRRVGWHHGLRRERPAGQRLRVAVQHSHALPAHLKPREQWQPRQPTPHLCHLTLSTVTSAQLPLQPLHQLIGARHYASINILRVGTPAPGVRGCSRGRAAIQGRLGHAQLHLYVARGRHRSPHFALLADDTVDMQQLGVSSVEPVPVAIEDQ